MTSYGIIITVEDEHNTAPMVIKDTMLLGVGVADLTMFSKKHVLFILVQALVNAL